MNGEMELEIDLQDLLYRVLKKWRKIIASAVIIALLAGGFKFAMGMLSLQDPEAIAEAEKKYEQAVREYEAAGESLEARIDSLQKQFSAQQDYNNNSLLMEIDPMEKFVGSFLFYVDSNYQINPSLTYQNVDMTGRLLTAYASYLRSSETYDEILAQIDVVSEIPYLTEILTYSVDGGAATITVTCVGENEEDIRKILDIVKTTIRGKYQTVTETIGEHTQSIMAESVYSTTDLNLYEVQKANNQAISNYVNEIELTNEALEEWESTPEPEMEFGLWYTTKESIKMIILGGIAGGILMVMLYAVAYVMSRKLKVHDDWRMFGITVLGHIYQEEEKKGLWKIDRWIDQYMGQRQQEISLTESCKLAAHNLSATLKEQSVEKGVLVGDIDEQLATDITSRMNDAGNGMEFVYAGNILTTGKAIEQLGEFSQVILLAQIQMTTYDHIQEEKTLLTAWGKSILGVVTVE